MADIAPPQPFAAPLGLIEPHANLLTLPPVNQLLYKVMKVEHLLASIERAYLHFNRVDSYIDFPDADPHDGQQLPADQAANATTHFERAPEFTAAAYYDQCRARTYACCFALENADHLWRTYGNGGTYGNVGVVFDFQKLREHLNRHLAPGQAQLLYQGIACKQIFSVNYGVVEYVAWGRRRVNAEHLPNPIRYTYLKASRFSVEKELRISLSSVGIGNFALNDGEFIVFPTGLQVQFDLRAAIAGSAIQQILLGSDCDATFLHAELARLGIGPVPPVE